MVTAPANKKIKVISGDSLEEDFLIEDGFAPSEGSLSGDEAGEVYDQSSDVEEQAAVPIVAVNVGPSANKKRKIKEQKTALETGEPKVKKPKKVKEGRVLETSVGLLDLSSLVSKLAQKQKKAMPLVSQIEMDDLRILGASAISSHQDT